MFNLSVSMQKIVCIFFFTLFFFNATFGQELADTPLKIDASDRQFFIRDYVSYYTDSTRGLSFKTIKTLPFRFNDAPKLDFQSKNWYKFYIKPEVNKTYLIFSPSRADSATVFVPYKTTYKKIILGLLTDTSIGFSSIDKTFLKLPTDSIDFSKPFYFNKVILTRTGRLNSKNLGYVVLADNIFIWKNKKDKAIGYTRIEHVFIAAFLIAMFIFFANYLVTKDRNFLNYSLYLLFTSLIFANRLSFAVNFSNIIHPIFMDCITTVSIVMASVSYFYFVITFLDVKENYPKIYPLAKYTVIGSLIVATFIIIQLLFIPYLSFRFLILDIYNIVFLVISVFVFIYLVRQRLSLIHRIIIFGSFLLIIGQLLSLITASAFYFIGAVILEIIAFSSVVSFQNKLSSYNRLVSENALQKEKTERENLQELTQLKSRFITNITHEFRTPLTIIQGYVDNLNEDFNGNEKVTATLNTIKQSSNNLLNLVNQMLDLDALENKKLGINLIQDDVVSFTLKIINRLNNLALEKQINIDFKTNETKILMDFDAEKLRQILSNLISNAIKFSPENSKIKIALKKCKNHTLQIKVSDQGFGIADKDIPFIFDRFYQVESETQKIYQGTGIGLALTKELVELFDATISVESQLNIGSTFTVILPITSNAILERAIQDIDIINSTHQNVPITATHLLNTVLIVEDNKAMANFIASCLNLTYNILFATDGKAGLEQAETSIPDIIITDIMMPFVDGFELIQKLQENPKTNHIPIIALTSKSEHEDKLEGISSGADVYLTKPFEKDELILRTQMLIAKRLQLQERYNIEDLIENKNDSLTQTDKNIVFLNSLMRAVHQHIDDSHFGSKELAAFLAMSDSQLYRKLKAISNTSTAIFIRKVRLEKAKEMLINTDLSVSEIAYATGFNDPNWFSKAFKEEFKLSPSEARN